MKYFKVAYLHNNQRHETLTNASNALEARYRVLYDLLAYGDDIELLETVEV